MKIAAIIVTCNRKEMLSKLLDDFMTQNKRPDGILVIDNGSEDGTQKYVKDIFPSVFLIELDHNIGLFGGLELGITKAIEQGYDAVWLIDDDARLRKDTLESLLHAIDLDDQLKQSVLWCANVTPDGQFFTEPVCVNVGNEWRVYHSPSPELENKTFETTGGPNIGVYIPKSVIESAGPPLKEMVFCGEYEFVYRVKQAGYKIFRCFTSIVFHKRNTFTEFTFMGKKRFVSQTAPWHTYYEMRNCIFMDLKFKRRSILKSLLIASIDSIFKLYYCDKKISTAVYITRAVHDGLRGKMGLRVPIPR